MGNQQRIFHNNEWYTQHNKYTELFISETGNVYSQKNRRLKYVFAGKRGYKVVQIKFGGKTKTLKVHRLVAETHLPPPTQEMVDLCSLSHWKVPCVKHLDNDKQNNHVTNLQWDTQEANNRDAARDGIVPPLKGSLNGRAILTEDTVHALCKDYQDGMQPKEAMAKYGISSQQASKIRTGFAWKHISELYNIHVKKRSKTIENTLQSNGSE